MSILIFLLVKGWGLEPVNDLIFGCISNSFGYPVSLKISTQTVMFGQKFIDREESTGGLIK